jgi:hypothetical protein
MGIYLSKSQQGMSKITAVIISEYNEILSNAYFFTHFSPRLFWVKSILLKKGHSAISGHAGGEGSNVTLLIL